jgi:P-type E1-E2 ATPase
MCPGHFDSAVFLCGIGGLSSRGVLIKGADVIDSLAKVQQVVMDKTGTLTSGQFAVEEILHAEDPEQILQDAAAAEYFSNHPIAKGITAGIKVLSRIMRSRMSKRFLAEACRSLSMEMYPGWQL